MSFKVWKSREKMPYNLVSNIFHLERTFLHHFTIPSNIFFVFCSNVNIFFHKFSSMHAMQFIDRIFDNHSFETCLLTITVSILPMAIYHLQMNIRNSSQNLKRQVKFWNIDETRTINHILNFKPGTETKTEITG